jgi:hypothetical protein
MPTGEATTLNAIGMVAATHLVVAVLNRLVLPLQVMVGDGAHWPVGEERMHDVS